MEAHSSTQANKLAPHQVVRQNPSPQRDKGSLVQEWSQNSPHAQGPTVLRTQSLISALTYLDRKQEAFGMLHRGGSALQEYGGAMRPVVYTSHSGDTIRKVSQRPLISLSFFTNLAGSPRHQPASWRYQDGRSVAKPAMSLRVTVQTSKYRREITEVGNGAQRFLRGQLTTPIGWNLRALLRLLLTSTADIHGPQRYPLVLE